MNCISKLSTLLTMIFKYHDGGQAPACASAPCPFAAMPQGGLPVRARSNLW